MMKRIMIDPSTKPDRQLRITDMHAAFNADWLLSARGLPMTSVAARRSGILDRLRLLPGMAAARGKPFTTVCGVTCANSLEAG